MDGGSRYEGDDALPGRPGTLTGTRLRGREKLVTVEGPRDESLVLCSREEDSLWS